MEVLNGSLIFYTLTALYFELTRPQLNCPPRTLRLQYSHDRSVANASDCHRTQWYLLADQATNVVATLWGELVNLRSSSWVSVLCTGCVLRHIRIRIYLFSVHQHYIMQKLHDSKKCGDKNSHLIYTEKEIKLCCPNKDSMVFL